MKIENESISPISSMIFKELKIFFKTKKRLGELIILSAFIS